MYICRSIVHANTSEGMEVVLEASPNEPFYTIRQKLQDIEGKAVPEVKTNGSRCLFLSQPAVALTQYLSRGELMREIEPFSGQVSRGKKGEGFCVIRKNVHNCPSCLFCFFHFPKSSIIHNLLLYCSLPFEAYRFEKECNLELGHT